MRCLPLSLGEIVMAVLVAGVFCASPVQGMREKKEHIPSRSVVFCDEDTLTAATIGRLLEVFPKGSPIIAEAFDGEEARLFLDIFGSMFPALSIFSAESVAVFSVKEISVLFFISRGCLVGDHALSVSAYEGIKTVMYGKGCPVP